jgi:RNA polymerase sigma factor for flagellar operon FliA
MITTTSLRDELILSHMPQVELLARRLHRRCPQVELDDLISAGTVGLIHATDRYDESKGYLLKTLAEHRIRGAMLDYLRQIDPLPRNVRRFQKQRDAVISQMAAAGEVLNPERLAQALGVSPRKYAALSRMIVAAEPVSIHDAAIAKRLTG